MFCVKLTILSSEVEISSVNRDGKKNNGPTYEKLMPTRALWIRTLFLLHGH